MSPAAYIACRRSSIWKWMNHRTTMIAHLIQRWIPRHFHDHLHLFPGSSGLTAASCRLDSVGFGCKSCPCPLCFANSIYIPPMFEKPFRQRHSWTELWHQWLVDGVFNRFLRVFCPLCFFSWLESALLAVEHGRKVDAPVRRRHLNLHSKTVASRSKSTVTLQPLTCHLVLQQGDASVEGYFLRYVTWS